MGCTLTFLAKSEGSLRQQRHVVHRRKSKKAVQPITLSTNRDVTGIKGCKMHFIAFTNKMLK